MNSLILEDFEFYLHLGPHKTGTTSFQKYLEDNESNLNQEGFNLITARSNLAAQYKEFRKSHTRCAQQSVMQTPDEIEPMVNRLSEIWQDFTNLLNPSYSKVIISDENLLGPMLGHYFAKMKGRETGIYQAKVIVLKGLKKAMGNNIKKILLCRRDLYSFLTSSYRDFIIKLNHPETPLEFFAAWDEDIAAEYDAFFNYVLGSEFQSGQVLIKQFREFTNDFPSILKEFTICNKKLKPPRTSSSNKSISWSAVEYALKEIPKIRDKEEDKIELRRYLRNRFEETKQPEWIETELNEIKQRFM